MARDCKSTHKNPTDFCEVSNSPIAWAAKYLIPVNCKHDLGHKQMLLHITFVKNSPKISLQCLKLMIKVSLIGIAINYAAKNKITILITT